MWEKLIAAIKNRNTAEAIELIEKIEPQELNERRDNAGNTALLIATQIDLRWGTQEISMALIHKMSPEAIKAGNENGYTALHYAAMISKELCEAIVDKASDAIDAVTRVEGGTAARVSEQDDTEPVDAIAEDRQTVLHFAARGNKEGVFEFLAGKMASEAIKTGETLLHIAAKGGNEELCKTILTILVNIPQAINTIDKYGHTVLHYAAGGKKEVFKLLMHEIDEKAIDAVSRTGQLALHVAARSYNKEIIWMILDKLPALYTFPSGSRTPPDLEDNKNFKLVNNIIELRTITFNKFLLLEVLSEIWDMNKDSINLVRELLLKLLSDQVSNLKAQMVTYREMMVSAKPSLTDENKVSSKEATISTISDLASDQSPSILFDLNEALKIKSLAGTFTQQMCNVDHALPVYTLTNSKLVSDVSSKLSAQELKTFKIVNAEFQNEEPGQEKNCDTLVRPVKSLVQQHQSEENTMSKQIIATNQAQQEELKEEQTPLAIPEGNDKAITTYQEKKVVYEKRLDFGDKRLDEEIDIMDYRKVDLQRTAEIEAFFRESVSARSLDLSGNPLDSYRSTIATLKGLEAICVNLTDLNLSSCSAHTYPWAKGISEFLTNNTSLTGLNLSNNDIGGTESIAALNKALETNSALTSLNLSNNGVGGLTDAEAFADMLKTNTTLTDLNLANNEICAGSWENELSKALKANTTLKALNLLGNNIKSGDLPLEEVTAKVLIAPSGRGLIFNEELWQSYIRLGVQPGLSG